MQSLSMDLVWTYLEDTALPAFTRSDRHIRLKYDHRTQRFFKMRSLNGSLNTTLALLILEGLALYNLSLVESASLLLGALLRQLRVSPRQCSNAIAASLAQNFARCYPEYFLVDEDIISRKSTVIY